MQEALKQARLAFAADQVPIGAVVVDKEGTIIGQGYNQVETSYTQRMHAEMIALEQAGIYKKDWRLLECWLYVTLEPCMMCMGLAYMSRLAGIVYGATSPLFGYHLDSGQATHVYQKDMPVIAGVCGDESAGLLKQFFQIQREQESESNKRS